MSLITVPPKIYKELTKSVIEDDETSHFSFADLKKNHSSSYNDIFEYTVVAGKCKYIGEGSSRIAFLIPAGAVETDKSIASCLKLAKNKPGIAQNKTEINLYNRDKNYLCFPEIYDYDNRKFQYLLAEIGEQIVGFSKFDKYFEEWNTEFSNFFDDSYDISFYKITNFQLITRNLIAYARDINTDECKQFDKFLNTMAFKGNEKYSAILSLFQYTKHVGKDKLILGDFSNRENWAFVTRKGQEQLIPIDFGFSSEVRDKYYGANRGVDWEFSDKSSETSKSSKQSSRQNILSDKISSRQTAKG